MTMAPLADVHIRNDWTREEVEALFCLPFNDLMFRAQQVHRYYFDPNEVQMCTLLSIKTGACPEDCKYCGQSSRYKTGLAREKLMEIEAVEEKARQAKASGASRFCMGAAWRGPRDRDMEAVLEMIRRVKALGLETCVTLGMLTEDQTARLAEAGLDYYNHNLDTSPEFYGEIITTRTYDDRLQTLAYVRESGIKVCSGGILGMGENMSDRAGLLLQLATLPVHPESVPINQLVKVAGTPLADIDDIDSFEFIRCIAVARLLMPKAYVRLSAGRRQMTDEAQALAFMAGANSMWLGDKLLTTANPDKDHDEYLFQRLGIKAQESASSMDRSEGRMPLETPLYYNAAG